MDNVYEISKYNFSVFYRGEIKNNQKNRQEPKKEFQTAEYKAILTYYVSQIKSCHNLHSRHHIYLPIRLFIVPVTDKKRPDSAY